MKEWKKEDGPPAVGTKAVLLFGATWHDSTEPMKQVLEALAQASSSNSSDTDTPVSTVVFGYVDAEACSSLTDRYKVTTVPTFVLIQASGEVMRQIQGEPDRVADITLAVQQLSAATSGTGESFPSATDTFQEKTGEEGKDEDALSARLERLIKSSEVMLFMKGVPSAPRCGFSRKAVELLQSESIPFGSFDILQDEAVRQGLKKYSNWPTYPQVYVRGDLVGGLDILQEMKQESGGLREQLEIAPAVEAASSTTVLPSSDQKPAVVVSLEDRLNALVRRHRLMLFMKGLPSAPRCGFSSQMVSILDELGVSYDAFDILQDEEVRQGLKTFSNWPTYPQLYLDGDLVGGLDIVKEMQADGSLQEALGALKN